MSDTYDTSDQDQGTLPPWLMGALAQQGSYDPTPAPAMPAVRPGMAGILSTDDAAIGNPMGEVVPPAPITTPGDWNPVPQYLASLQSDDMSTIGKRTIGAVRRSSASGAMSPEDEATIQEGVGLGMGFAGTVKNVARAAKMSDLAAPAIVGKAAEKVPYVSNLALPSPIERYITDPQRIYRPGIYKDPREIAAQANAMVAPEHPALQALFGVTRDDLYGISQQGTRQGNVAPNIWQPSKPGVSYAAENIMNPANAQRLIDTLSEARKYPGLERGMVPWYVMDPAYQRLEQLVGPQRAVDEYNKFNSMMTPFSASSDVMKEINRGTAARMMYERGQLPDFVKYGGMPVEARGVDFPSEMADVIPHLRHAPTHTDPVTSWANTGQHGYGQNTVKIPLYTQASGVPQTGFQTAWPVPDAHFTRAVGMSDARKNASPGNFMEGPEYRTMAPWFRQNVAQPLGLEGVPTQALTWGTYAPQTGVKTPIGAGKLELLSQRIWERAQRLGIDPAMLRDKVLLGQEHAQLEDDNQGMGALAAQDRYA